MPLTRRLTQGPVSVLAPSRFTTLAADPFEGMTLRTTPTVGFVEIANHRRRSPRIPVPPSSVWRSPVRSDQDDRRWSRDDGGGVRLKMTTGTVLGGFGNFLPGVPETLHICTYPAASANRAPISRTRIVPANGGFCDGNLRPAGVVAMQEVEGSSPFSRFFANPLHVGRSASTGESRINWNRPRISPSFRALIRISACLAFERSER